MIPIWPADGGDSSAGMMTDADRTGQRMGFPGRNPPRRSRPWRRCADRSRRRRRRECGLRRTPRRSGTKPRRRGCERGPNNADGQRIAVQPIGAAVHEDELRFHWRRETFDLVPHHHEIVVGGQRQQRDIELAALGFPLPTSCEEKPLCGKLAAIFVECRQKSRSGRNSNRINTPSP